MKFILKPAILLLVLASAFPTLGQSKPKTHPIIVRQFKTTLDIASIPWTQDGLSQETGYATVYTAPETGLYRVSMQVIRHIDGEDCNRTVANISLILAVMGGTNGQVPAQASINSSGCFQGLMSDQNTLAPATAIQANAGSPFQWALGVIFGVPVTGTIDVYIVIERLM
jgi:hypothetical protein